MSRSYRRELHLVRDRLARIRDVAAEIAVSDINEDVDGDWPFSVRTAVAPRVSCTSATTPSGTVPPAGSGTWTSLAIDCGVGAQRARDSGCLSCSARGSRRCSHGLAAERLAITS